MNDLQALKKERKTETSEPVISPQNPEASSFEGLSAPSQPSTLLPTPGAQALGSWPLSWPHLTPNSLLCAPLCGGGHSAHSSLCPCYPVRAGAGAPTSASVQPAGGGSRQAGSSQPAAGRSQCPAVKGQEIEPECDRQAVSAERQEDGQVSTVTAHGPRRPLPKCIKYPATPAPIRCCYFLKPAWNPHPTSCFCLFLSPFLLLLPCPPFSHLPLLFSLSSPCLISLLSPSSPSPSLSPVFLLFLFFPAFFLTSFLFASVIPLRLLSILLSHSLPFSLHPSFFFLPLLSPSLLPPFPENKGPRDPISTPHCYQIGRG